MMCLKLTVLGVLALIVSSTVGIYPHYCNHPWVDIPLFTKENMELAVSCISFLKLYEKQGRAAGLPQVKMDWIQRLSEDISYELDNVLSFVSPARGPRARGKTDTAVPVFEPYVFDLGLLREQAQTEMDRSMARELIHKIRSSDEANGEARLFVNTVFGQNRAITQEEAEYAYIVIRALGIRADMIEVGHLHLGGREGYVPGDTVTSEFWSQVEIRFGYSPLFDLAQEGTFADVNAKEDMIRVYDKARCVPVYGEEREL